MVDLEACYDPTHGAASLPQNTEREVLDGRKPTGKNRTIPNSHYGLLSRVKSPWSAACTWPWRLVWCALWARWIQLETEVQRTSEWGIIYYTWCNELGTYKRMHPSVYGVVFRSLILTGCSRVYGRMLSRLLFFVIFGWIRTTSTSRGLACYSKTCSENCPSKNRDIALWMYIPAYLVRCAAPNFTNLEAH